MHASILYSWREANRWASKKYFLQKFVNDVKELVIDIE